MGGGDKAGNICYDLGFAFFSGAQSRSLALCLQAEKNSDLLLMFAPSLWNIIKYFSVRQSLQVSVTGLYAGAFASCLNLREYWICLSLSFQMCLDRHVAVLLALVSFLKLVLWLLYLSFQLGSLTPV